MLSDALLEAAAVHLRAGAVVLTPENLQLLACTLQSRACERDRGAAHDNNEMGGRQDSEQGGTSERSQFITTGWQHAERNGCQHR